MAIIIPFKRKISNVIPLRLWASKKVEARKIQPEIVSNVSVLIKVRVCENCHVTQAADNSNLCSLCASTKISHNVHWLNK
jgi:hypothetical protein